MEGKQEENGCVPMNGSAPTSSKKSLWTSYQLWLIRNERLVWLFEESVSRLLFWSPPSTRGRETLLGLLELHRSLVQCALAPADDSSACSVATHDPAAQSLRLSLAVIQSLWPVAQEWVRVWSSSEEESAMSQAYRPAVVRRGLERCRFVLRMALLVRAWQQIRAANATTNASVLPGLLLHGGGLYHSHAGRPVPYHLERARIERREYVGRRTGRRMASVEPAAPILFARRIRSVRWLRLVLGEFLYVLRPLLQAEADVTTCYDTTWTRKMRVWALSLAMDVLSVWSIGGECAGPYPLANAVTVHEWKRRRLRLFLYLLRSPIWDRCTEPAVQRMDDIVYRVPLVGGLLRNFLWDWIYYWRVFKAEEG